MTHTNRRGRRLLVVAGAGLSAVSAIAIVLLFLQPWASCPGVDDSAAGCPVPPAQAAMQVGFAVAFVAGVLAVLAGIVLSARASRPAR